MTCFEVTTSWYSTDAKKTEVPRRLAVVIQNDGAIGILAHGVTGEAAHVIVRSTEKVTTDRTQLLGAAANRHPVISILAAALMAAALTHGLWLAAVD